jgi:hypothetical protein
MTKPTKPSHPSHRGRIAAAAFLAAGVTLLIVLALVNSSAFGSKPDPNFGHKVTLCHQEGNGSWHDITVDVDAGGLKGGHQGHDGDIIPPFTYVNKDDVQVVYPGKNLSAVFDGSTGAQVLANACVIPPVVVDKCPNLPGNQATVPEGYVLNSNGECVKEVPPVDACPNIEGDQATVPEGYVINADGDCVKPDTPPVDLCPNIDGDQATLPDGHFVNSEGNCVKPDVPGTVKPVDVCPNLDGDQTEVPAGLELKDGACVGTPSPSTPGAGGGDTPDAVAGATDDPVKETPAKEQSDEATEPRKTGNKVKNDGQLPYTGAQQNILIGLGVFFILIGSYLEFGHRRKHKM